MSGEPTPLYEKRVKVVPSSKAKVTLQLVWEPRKRKRTAQDFFRNP